MVSKNTRPGSRASSAKKPAGRPSRRTKKPVTIDLEATASKDKPVAAKTSDTASKPTGNQPAKIVPGIGQKAGDKTGLVSSEPAKKPASKSAANPSWGRKDEKIPPSSPKTDGSTDTPSKAAPAKGKSAADKAIKSGKPGSTGKIMAGIIGGIIALGGAYVLQVTGIIPAATRGDTAISENMEKLQNQLSVLSAKVDGASKPDLAPFEKRLGQLETQEKQRAKNMSNAGEIAKARDGKITTLAATFQQLKDSTAKLQQSISSGAAGENAGLSALAERITSLEGATEMADNLDAVSAKIEVLANKVTALSATVSSSNDDTGKKIAAEIALIGKNVVAIENQLSQGLTKTGESLAGVETGIAANLEKVTVLGQRIDALETSVNTPRKDEQRVARAMAVAGLKSAIDSGRGLGDALSLYEGLSNDPQSVASLKDYAETGILDISSISASFARLSDKIVTAALPKSDGSVMGRFLDNARSLVKVKSIGAIEGDGAKAIVSRIEAALKSGDLDVVLREWETLPDTAKAVSGDWINQVKARSKANALIDNLLKQFMTGITGTNN